MLVNMVTNGVYGRHSSAAEVAKRAIAAGMCNVGVSIDGPEEIHDRIRGKGTFSKTAQSITTFRSVGLLTTVMCTVNRLNINHLEKLREIAVSLGARALRFQLAKPMGTMDEHREWVISASAIPGLLQRIVRMKQQGGIDVRVGDSLGYYGKPDKVLRHRTWNNKKTRWGGCQAGLKAIGIQANGDIKGCLSLQAARGETDPFVEGNIRKTPLREIWYREGAFAYNRDFSLDALTHDCKTCKQAALCRGGARCISTAMDGTLTHDDYCYYRLMSEKEQQDWLRWSRSAAAAAALAATVNVGACDDSDPTPPPEYGVDYYDTETETLDSDDDTDSGTETDIDSATADDSDTSSTDAIDTSDTDSDTAALEYAVEPVDTDTDSAALDYAVEPVDTDSETMVLEYAVEPIDTDTDSAALDYAVEPVDTDTDSAALDYAVEPVDTETDIYTPEYAVEPDYAVEPVPEYAVEPENKDTD
jgi:radical SAM protein with 4Fe4S-binding SPASM domain